MSTSLLSGPAPEACPSRSNPFARPSLKHEPSNFKRASLLPTLSPEKVTRPYDPQYTPADKGQGTGESGSHVKGSAGKARQSWRLLWRGGLEIGPEGWRLDGVTFFALLSFPPPTPSQQIGNPFDAPIQPLPHGPTSSPFTSVLAGDTDLCLSLESMRGRKYLQIRRTVHLSPDEVLDGGDEAGGVQMSISPSAPLLIAYFTGLLCRSPGLSPQGRTLTAVHVGLGDESVESGSSGILVYGQLDPFTSTSLRLCVGRRKIKPVPPSEQKVRPGEPLPRAPLLFPSKASKKPPPPFPRRSQSFSRTFLRAPSTNSIYLHPQASRQASLAPPELGPLQAKRRLSADVECPPSKVVRRTLGTGQRSASETIKPLPPESMPTVPDKTADEDIFGKKPLVRKATDLPSVEAESSSAKAKKPRVPQQILDNKATIRKQTLVLLEERGIPRQHPGFKDVFGMTTKGTGFALRDSLESGPLDKTEVQRIVTIHLDMYVVPTHRESMVSQEGTEQIIVKLESDEAREPLEADPAEGAGLGAFEIEDGAQGSAGQSGM